MVFGTKGIVSNKALFEQLVDRTEVVSSLQCSAIQSDVKRGKVARQNKRTEIYTKFGQRAIYSLPTPHHFGWDRAQG